MEFPKNYRCLAKNQFEINGFSLIPIRFEDRLDIMRWRNEQIDHLRQKEILTKENQEVYYREVLSPLFSEDQPNQILFSLLKNEKLIGYGGLVHINWFDQNAEISFIMETELQTNNFDEIWTNYLILLEKIAFQQLNFHKIYTYAFDIRPYLYETLENSGFIKEAILKEHCYFENNFIDVIIHSKINHEQRKS